MMRLRFSLTDQQVIFKDENDWLSSVNEFWHILKVSDTISVNFKISSGIRISKHSCNTHRLKASYLLYLYCISIYTPTEHKYTHPRKPV